MSYTIRCHHKGGKSEYDAWFAGFNIDGRLRWAFEDDNRISPMPINSIHEARKILNLIVMNDIEAERPLKEWTNFIEEITG